MNDLESLRRAFRRGERPKFLFFWGHQARSDGELGCSCLSQWWPARFTVDGCTYASAEHFMMAEKARRFGDGEMRARILAAGSPGAAKALGRKVRGFDQGIWVAHRFDIVVAGSRAKFGQDDRLRAFLLGTKGRVLVEASPKDCIWGIGMGATDRRAENPLEWRGLNLLGFALMTARQQLDEEVP